MKEAHDELMIRLIERLIMAARNRALAERYPGHASGFRKMELRHHAAATALMVKVLDRQATEEACRSCPFARRS